MAREQFPHSLVVHKLRGAMQTASVVENHPALEEFLLLELKARPKDVQLRVSNFLVLILVSLTDQTSLRCSKIYICLDFCLNPMNLNLHHFSHPSSNKDILHDTIRIGKLY